MRFTPEWSSVLVNSRDLSLCFSNPTEWLKIRLGWLWGLPMSFFQGGFLSELSLMAKDICLVTCIEGFLLHEAELLLRLSFVLLLWHWTLPVPEYASCIDLKWISGYWSRHLPAAWSCYSHQWLMYHPWMSNCGMISSLGDMALMNRARSTPSGRRENSLRSSFTTARKMLSPSSDGEGERVNLANRLNFLIPHHVKDQVQWTERLNQLLSDSEFFQNAGELHCLIGKNTWPFMYRLF